MKRGGKRLYQLTPLGREKILQAFYQLGLSASEAADPSFPIPELREGDSPVPNHPQERWQVTSSFRLGSAFLSRGSWLSDDETMTLEHSHNAEQLKSSFLRKSLPPPDWAPTTRRTPPPIAATYATKVAPSWVSNLAAQAEPTSWSWKLAAALLATGKPISVGIDLVPRDLLGFATAEYGLAKKPNMGSVVRRSVDHFNEFLALVVQRVKSQQKEAA